MIKCLFNKNVQTFCALPNQCTVQPSYACHALKTKHCVQSKPYIWSKHDPEHVHPKHFRMGDNKEVVNADSLVFEGEKQMWASFVMPCLN